MKKVIEVTISTDPKKMRIRQLKAVSLAPVKGFNRIEEALYFLAEFTGLKHHQLLDFKIEDIKTMVVKALEAVASLDLTSALPQTIKIEGTKYCLVDPDKVGIGWHIDFKSCNIEKNPVRMACLFYLPEGFNYSDVDENGNIKYPIDSRHDVFDKHFPLDLFLRCCDFFLQRSLHSMKKQVISEQPTLKKKIELAANLISLTSGSKR